MTQTWLVVGLGNPGPTYEGTRHNAGFLVVDELARRARASFSSRRDALVASTTISAAGLGIPPGDKLVLCKPQTYMNESGRAVGPLAKFLSIGADRIIVIHDELDLDLGHLRVKFGGGDNGHNGLKSVRAHVGTGDFYRVRFGVGRPPGRMDVVDYVLRRFTKTEADERDIVTAEAADAVESLAAVGLAATQNRFNS